MQQVLPHVLLWLLLGSQITMGYAAESLQITGVHADRSVLRMDGEGTPKVSIEFHLNAPAQVTLTFYDARDYLVRQIVSNGRLQPGDQTLLWDGRDQQGRPVPSEAYIYTLTAIGEDGKEVVHDLTDATGGDTVIPDEVIYDVEKGTVNYVLPYKARLFVRIGLKDGSVLRTLVNNAVRDAGLVMEPWDGWDESHVIRLDQHPNRDIYVEGFRLSQNTILVQGKVTHSQQSPRAATPMKQAVKRTAVKRGKGLNRHAYHPIEQCRDIKIRLSLPSGLPKNSEGLPIISGPAPLRMEIEPEDERIMEAQRFEVVYFLNNQLLYENEVSYAPYTWTWKPKVLVGGIHYITAFVVGYGGHYGVATVKFELAKGEGSKEISHGK